MRDQLEKNPKLAEKLRANGRISVRGWANAVRAGAMTREEFDDNVEQELECGRLDPADADDARRTLD